PRGHARAGAREWTRGGIRMESIAYTRAELWEAFLHQHLTCAALVAEHVHLHPLEAPRLEVKLELAPDGRLVATADQAHLHAYVTHCLVEALPEAFETILAVLFEEEPLARAA